MSRLRVPPAADDHALGPEDAPITLVEYGDFECPYCAAAEPEVKALLRALGDRIRFIFRHLPLTQAHPHALQAAEAAEAAGAQGKFWEMHDLLFANQENLDPQSLLAYASTLELDVDRFTEDLDSHRFAEKIRRDLIGGVRSGVNGTPTFFVNGEKHVGPPTRDALLATIEGGPAVAF